MDTELGIKLSKIINDINDLQIENKQTYILGGVCSLYFDMMTNSIDTYKTDERTKEIIIDELIQMIDKVKDLLNDTSCKLIAKKGEVQKNK